MPAISEVLTEVLVDLDDTLLERSLRSLKVVVFNLALEHHSAADVASTGSCGPPARGGAKP